MGWDGEKGVEARIGHVALGQVQFYVIIPITALIITLAPALLLSQTRWAYIGNIWSAILMTLALPYLFFWGGGV
jgi:hypothetical protein